jgi:hypothetical protein
MIAVRLFPRLRRVLARILSLRALGLFLRTHRRPPQLAPSRVFEPNRFADEHLGGD